MKFVKKTGMYYANEESFKIYDGSTLLYTSPTFANNDIREIEQCISATTNNQYKIDLLDSYGDSWSAGALLTIFGQYGNTVFKNMLTDARKETYSLSLYYAIEKGATWKLTSGSVSNGWTAYSFSDSTWTDATLGSVTATVSGTQYFRRQFVGLSNMAAYDVRLYYKAGVIAYINGAEVYRDNLSAGDVTSSTPATGQYQDIAYRGFIRPGSEVASQQSILAVEVHFLAAQTTVDFNAYLAILASSTTDANCFIYSDSVSINSNGGVDPAKLFDFSLTTSFYSTYAEFPTTLTFTFEGPKPYINSVRVWPYTYTTSAPGEFTFQGSNDNQQWANAISVSGAVYTTSTYKIFGGYFYSSLYNYYRLNIVDSTSTPYVEVFEFQPLICTTATPTSITFTPNTYTFWAKYESVYIRPDITEFTSCTAQNLPPGLSIDSTTCVISGVVNSVVSSMSISVSSVVLGNTYTGSFTLTIQECSGSMINVLRTYQWDVFYETFQIIDTSNQQVVMSVAYDPTQESNVEWTNIACLTGQRYEVLVGSALSYWNSSSQLYVRSYLDGSEMETTLRIRNNMYIGLPTSRYFYAQYAIPSQSKWYYKHGETPADWYSSTSTDGWIEENTSSFTEYSNQIQLYKKSFSVSDISNIAGFVMSFKYKYGCVIY